MLSISSNVLEQYSSQENGFEALKRVMNVQKHGVKCPYSED